MNKLFSVVGLIVVSFCAAACGGTQQEPQVSYVPANPCERDPNGNACQNYLFGMDSKGDEAATKREAIRKEDREKVEARKFDVPAGTRTERRKK